MPKITKLNVDEHPGVAQKYGIMSIPALKIFKGGQVVKEFIGIQTKDKLKTELRFSPVPCSSPIKPI